MFFSKYVGTRRASWAFLHLDLDFGGADVANRQNYRLRAGWRTAYVGRGVENWRYSACAFESWDHI